MKYLSRACNVALITLALCAASSIQGPSATDAATRVVSTERDSSNAKKVNKRESKSKLKKKADKPSGKRSSKRTPKNSMPRSSNHRTL